LHAVVRRLHGVDFRPEGLRRSVEGHLGSRNCVLGAPNLVVPASRRPILLAANTLMVVGRAQRKVDRIVDCTEPETARDLRIEQPGPGSACRFKKWPAAKRKFGDRTVTRGAAARRIPPKYPLRSRRTGSSRPPKAGGCGGPKHARYVPGGLAEPRRTAAANSGSPSRNGVGRVLVTLGRLVVRYSEECAAASISAWPEDAP